MKSLRDAAAAAAGGLGWLERVLLIAGLALLAALPLAEALGRRFGGFLVPGAAEWIRILVLWLTFVGGLYATGRMRHLTLSTTDLMREGPVLRWGRLAATFLA